MNESLVQKIELLTGISDHLQFIDFVTARQSNDGRLGRNIARQAQAVRDRMHDERLYLAVVGEMSAGKSTFINALLRDDLLKTNILTMTTAAATVIEQGDDLTASVRLRNRASIPDGVVFSERSAERLEFLNDDTEQSWVIHLSSANEPINGNNLRDYIRAITTEESFTTDVLSITLTHPTVFLDGGIVIIDTPGADASNPAHEQITRNAVANADAVIILVPAHQPVTNTLKRLLEDEALLKPFLGRSVFVMSMMDRPRDENERSRVLSRLDGLLDELALTAERPPVFSCAAAAIIDELEVDEPTIQSHETREYWAQSFRQLEIDLKKQLERGRAIIVSQNVLLLIDRALEALDEVLSERWADHEEARIELEAAVIADLDAFTNRQIDDADAAMRQLQTDALDASERTINEWLNAILGRLQELLNDISNIQQLKSYVDDTIPSAVKVIQTEMGKQLEVLFQAMTDDAIQIEQRLDERFEALFEELPTLESSETALTIRSESSIVFSTNQFKMAIWESGAFKINIVLVGTGVAAGAVLGKAVGGTTGALFGALLGGYLASQQDKSIGVRKHEVWDALKPQFTQQFADTRIRVQNDIRQRIGRNKDTIANRLHAHAIKYSGAVSQIRSEQEAKRQVILDLQANINRAQDELRARRARVQLGVQSLRSGSENNSPNDEKKG